jgi:uncharacterized protein YbjQ (UPF0145 family)
MEGPITVIILGASPFFFIFWALRVKKQKALKKIKIVDSRLKRIGNDVIAVTSGDFPGKTIKNTLGSVVGISDIAASTDEQFLLAEKEAMLNILTVAREMGANAVIGLRMSAGTYQQQGSQWMVTKVAYNGTAVQVGGH